MSTLALSRCMCNVACCGAPSCRRPCCGRAPCGRNCVESCLKRQEPHSCRLGLYGHYVQAPIQLQAIASFLQRALLRPSMTLAVGSCLRPVLLPLVDSLVEQALSTGSQSGASHAQTSVALISLLELVPHLERSATVLRCLQAPLLLSMTVALQGMFRRSARKH